MSRKHLLFLLSIILPAVHAVAQLTAEQRIQDSVIGWWNNNRFDHLKPATDEPGRQKTEMANRFVDWMIKTYTPVAGLGTSSRYIGQGGYGVNFLVWNVSHDKEWVDEKGRFKPIAEEDTSFRIATNKVFGAFDIEFIRKSGKNMFIMQPDGYAADDGTIERRKGTDPRIHPNVYNHTTWINEWHTVYIAPDHKLPIVPVTRGELLQAAEDALPTFLEAEKKTAGSQFSYNQKALSEALVAAEERIVKHREKIRKTRERYKASLNEPAVVKVMQLTVYSFDSDTDIFDLKSNATELKHAYPVYTIDPSLTGKTGNLQPLWIAVAFPYKKKEDGNQAYELYTALSENFNYDYVYNFFYGPASTKTKPYIPVNQEQLNARLSAYRQRTMTALNPRASTPANKLLGSTIFEDDLSGNTTGSSPSNWFYKGQGRHSIIATVPGFPGNWIQLGYNNPVTPVLMKMPLPVNFLLEFDIATGANFTGRTGGSVQLTLSSGKSAPDGTVQTTGPGSLFTIDIVPGNEENMESNYRGLLNIDLNSSPSLNTQNHSEGIVADIALKEFTNKKTKIHVSVAVKNGTVKVMINGQEKSNSADWKLKYGANCITCGFPANTIIQSVTWKNTTNSDPVVNAYLGNIRVEKL